MDMTDPKASAAEQRRLEAEAAHAPGIAAGRLTELARLERDARETLGKSLRFAHGLEVAAETTADLKVGAPEEAAAAAATMLTVMTEAVRRAYQRVWTETIAWLEADDALQGAKCRQAEGKDGDSAEGQR